MILDDLIQKVQNLEQQVRTLSVRIQHAIKPVRQVEASNEGNTIASAKVKANSRELRDLVIMQTYGFASAPLVGCDHMTIQIAGDSSNGLSIATNDQRYRPQTLTAGAAMVYDNSGNKILLAGGVITITAPNGLIVDTPNAHFLHDINCDGDVKAGTVSLRHHHHSGVQSGGSSTGEPIA